MRDTTFPTPELEELAKNLGAMEQDFQQPLPNHLKQKVRCFRVLKIIHFNPRTYIQNFNRLYPFLSFLYLSPLKTPAQEAPLISLKVLKLAAAPKPTLKAAFTACGHSTSEGTGEV